MQKSHRSNLMIASHNQYSIELAVGLMQKYNILPDGGVFFAQLLGMTDNLTNVLGLQGYQVIFKDFFFVFFSINSPFIFFF